MTNMKKITQSVMTGAYVISHRIWVSLATAGMCVETYTGILQRQMLPSRPHLFPECQTSFCLCRHRMCEFDVSPNENVWRRTIISQWQPQSIEQLRSCLNIGKYPTYYPHFTYQKSGNTVGNMPLSKLFWECYRHQTLELGFVHQDI